ncbi:MAG: hypothetical protein PHN18_05930 [Sulfurospirillaceae bacterium]|nr:hypothetical protein [Sulfurospirillaceae bacterium]MDD2825851.1 hypothetical protein [Sulfurospirillaceae bacterium]
MKKILTILALISTLFAAETTDFNDIDEEDIPKVLSIIKDGTKDNLPIMLDDYTTLFDIVALQNVIEYRNRIDSNNEHLKKLLKENKQALIETTYENNRNYLCGDSEIRYLLQKGATFVYVFFDLNNKELFKFSVQNKDCK